MTSVLPKVNTVAHEEVESKVDKQRQEDINVYVAWGVILLITALVVFLKISFQNIFLSSDEDKD